MQRLLIVSQVSPYPVYKNGGSLRVFHLTKEFSKRFYCEVITLEHTDLPGDGLETVGDHVTFHSMVPQGKRGMLGLISKIFSPKRLYSKTIAESIEKKVRSFKPTFIFAEQGVVAQYYVAFGDTPTVLSAVDSIAMAAKNEMILSKNMGRRAMWFCLYLQRRWLEKRYYKRFKCISAVAEGDTAYLSKILQKEVEFIPNGVDLDTFNPCYLGEIRDTLVFTGTLDASMNEEACIFLLEEVFPEIHKHNPDLKFLIGGRRPTKLLQKSVLPYVQLIDSPADIRYCLKNCLLFVAPISCGSGIKNSVLQAMAMGCAVCVTPLVAAPIGITNVKEGVRCVSERAEFMETVARLICDPLELVAAGMRSRKYVEDHFGWGSICDKYVKLMIRQ